MCGQVRLGLACLPKQVKGENLVLKSSIWCKSATSTLLKSPGLRHRPQVWSALRAGPLKASWCD